MKKAPAKQAANRQAAKKIKVAAKQAAPERAYFKQSDFPLYPLQRAERVATALVNDFGGKEGAPPDIALSMGVSPTSSMWRDLAGAAIAYGLTEGGPNASTIKLTALGKKLIAPEAEGDDLAARRQAITKPRIAAEFLNKYRRAKFPSDVIALNVLKSLGVPTERAPSALDILKANGKYSGIVRDTPTGPFVSLDTPAIPGPSVSADPTDSDNHLDEDVAQTDSSANSDAQNVSASNPPKRIPTVDPNNNRVFITHGKQKAIVTQIKELLAFGSFEPVVSVERESTAIPVPEKVFEDMRACGAGVIHVGSEGKYLDRDGAEHTKINDNVLIEIGAAMALYGKKVILLVEKGVQLPSNLQGLYRCEFDGDKLDYDSTMKLLKTFSQFR